MPKSSWLRHETSYDVHELNIGQKMLRFRKVNSENLKTGKLPATLATSYFQELIVNKSESKSN